MSGVRNLRAMFEQKGENNPPDRGRSPGPGSISVGSPSPPSHSPRPLSKVRTTFVAIEKDGRVGLRREHSGDSISVSSRRLSNDTEATTPQPAPEKVDVFAENMAKNASAFKTNLSQEAIPESPNVDTASKSSPKKEKDSRSPNIAPNPNPDKVTDEEETKTRLLPGNPTEKSATRGNSVTPTGRTSGTNVSTNGKPRAAPVTKPPPKAAPISTTTKSVSKAPKSPDTTKPANITTKPSASTTSLAPQKKPTPASSKDQETAKRTTAPAATKATVTSGKKPASIDLPPSGTGFVKPKPKSPTRPVKLPASLTAPTASSASKLGAGTAIGPAAHPPRQSLSRMSGNAQHLNVGSTLHRSPSRASISTIGTTANTRSLKRQNSTISRSRPSLGPPPKPMAKDHPVAKKDGHVDEGFLARMMRPTQSSSSKTSEKAPVTPPRKQSTPATAHKKPVAKEAEGNAKKATARIQASTNKAKATAESAKPTDKGAPTAKELAPIVAQTELAEIAIEAAKTSVDTVATSIAEKTVTEPVNVEESKAEDDEPLKTSPMPETAVPVITGDPEKVEDIEDLVQGVIEDPVDQQPSEHAMEVSEESKEVEDAQAATEANHEAALVDGEVTDAIKEPQVGPQVTGMEEIKVEETKEENVEVHEAKSGISSEDN